ncbi:MAG: anti-sigma factor domain-containing protein [Clostridiaceae bacterium]|nr:anti-sigma factor domain-containing protein [Clostridiaceae bacterium]
MIKQKGTILKFKDDLAIIMTSDCRIVSILKQPGMYVGLEVMFNPKEIIQKKSKLVLTSQIVAAVAAIFVFMFAFFNPFNDNGVYAYVTMDSNTSIEFELDKNNKILKVNSFSDDTSDLLKELNLKHQSVDVAIREVIKKSNLIDSTILITACLNEQSNTSFSSNKTNNSEDLKKLIDICKSAAEDDTNEYILSKVVETSYDYKKLASKNKTSIGRSIVYEKAKEQGVDLGIEEIKNKSIGEALKKVKIDDVSVVHDVKKAEAQKLDPEPKIKENSTDRIEQIAKKDPRPLVEQESKSEVKHETELKDKTEVKQETKPKVKPEVKQETKPKDKAEVKQEIKPKDKVEDKQEIKPKDKVEDKQEVEPKNKVEDKQEIKPKDKVEDKQEIKPKDKVEDKQEIKPKDKVEDKQEIEPKDKAEDKQETEPKDKAEDGQEAEPKDKVEDNQEIEPKEKPEVKQETEPKEKLEVKPETEQVEKKEAKPELEQDVEAELKTKVKSELETKEKSEDKQETETKEKQK